MKQLLVGLVLAGAVVAAIAHGNTGSPASDTVPVLPGLTSDAPAAPTGSPPTGRFEHQDNPHGLSGIVKDLQHGQSEPLVP